MGDIKKCWDHQTPCETLFTCPTSLRQIGEKSNHCKWYVSVTGALYAQSNKICRKKGVHNKKSHRMEMGEWWSRLQLHEPISTKHKTAIKWGKSMIFVVSMYVCIAE